MQISQNYYDSPSHGPSLIKRGTNAEIIDYLKETLLEQKHLDYRVEGNFIESELFQTLNIDLPLASNNEGREFLIKDITALARIFFGLKKGKTARLQLEIVKTDMCRLFHVDNIRQRLLCTYLGPGTEWLDDSNLNRDGIGRGCNSRIVKDFEKINRAEAFEVLLLKGVMYEGRQFAHAHRSPPIEKKAITRVLLKIDEYE